MKKIDESRRRFLKGTLGIGVGAALTALPRGVRAAAAKDVNVAVMYPTSGSQARFGQMCVNAIKIAVDDINNAGGIKALGGAKLNAIYADIQSETTVTRNQAERLMATGNLAAATGCYVSTYTLVATEVAERYKIPFITGSVADKLTERGFKYTFQVSPKASHFGQLQMEFAAKTAGTGKRVAIIYEDTDYGTATSKGFIDGAKKAGFEIVMTEPYTAKFTDATPLVNKIKAAKPDFLFPVSYITDALLIIRTMKQLNVNAGIFGGGAGYIIPDFYKDMGKDGEYVFSAASWNYDLNCGDVARFAAAYEKKHGEFLNEHAGEAYIHDVGDRRLHRARGLDRPAEGPRRDGEDQPDQRARRGHARLPCGVQRAGLEQAGAPRHPPVAERAAPHRSTRRPTRR